MSHATKLPLKTDATTHEKINWIGDRYFLLDRDVELKDKLSRLFASDDAGQLTSVPKQDPLTGETRGLMVIGASGAGKSALLKRTLRKLDIFKIADRDNMGNALYVTVPPEATMKSLASRIAKELGYIDINPRATSDEAWAIVFHRMSKMGITLLVIDETHHLLRKGPGRDVEGAIQRLKSLLQSDWPLAVIIAGVDKLRDGVMTDPETDRRFPKFQLTRVTLGSRDAHTFARSMQLCAENIGLTLTETTLPERVLFAEDGQPGRAINLAKLILVACLEAGHSHVSLQDAYRVFSAEYGELPISPFANAEWSTLRASLVEIGWTR
ncbi:TniB family NTP-binding protein (plasmid) [Thioclava sp. 'Guangxiensis']|uniref:TniB family NTP-binding protein n=1 Tax=Thioclava sp. 'Guangxiensis' TaxID=3149044 RepID=UPI0032C49D16